MKHSKIYLVVAALFSLAACATPKPYTIVDQAPLHKEPPEWIKDGDSVKDGFRRFIGVAESSEDEALPEFLCKSAKENARAQISSAVSSRAKAFYRAIDRETSSKMEAAVVTASKNIIYGTLPKGTYWMKKADANGNIITTGWALLEIDNKRFNKMIKDAISKVEKLNGTEVELMENAEKEWDQVPD